MVAAMGADSIIQPTKQASSYVVIKPNKIHFSSNEIPELFIDNLHVHFWITKLTTNPKIINTLPVMAVFQVEGCKEWYTCNNSLLYVYRVLHFRGIVKELQVCVIFLFIWTFEETPKCL